MTDKPKSKYPPPTEPGWQWCRVGKKGRRVLEIIRATDGQLVACDTDYYPFGCPVDRLSGLWGPRVPEPEDWP